MGFNSGFKGLNKALIKIWFSLSSQKHFLIVTFLSLSDSIQAVRGAGLPVVIPVWQSLPQSWSTDRKKTVCCLGC